MMMGTKNNKRHQMSINLFANILALLINMGISFFLVPYVTKNVGEEAYGFVTLGNNFVNYVSMVTISLNAMSGRFVTIAVHRKEYDKANRYYSSVFYANLFIIAIIIIPLICIVWRMEYILNVPITIVQDVKILWMFIFVNLFISLAGTVFGISTFCANRLDLSAKRNVEANLLKMVVVFIMFINLRPSVWYWGFAIMLSGMYIILTNIYYAHKLIPEMKISRNNFSLKSIIEILKAGVWNSVSRVGAVALTEFDVLLANLIISPKMMGMMALSKTLPTYVTSLTSNITNVFMPSLTIEYAKSGDNPGKLIKEVKLSIRVLLFFHCIVYGLLFGFFDCLYSVWMPSQKNNIKEIYIIGLISISGCFISAVASIVMNIFTVINKLKLASLSIVITGMVSLPVTVLLANITENDMSRGCIIAGVSVVLVAVRCIFFLIPYAGICIGGKWYTFFNDLLLNIAAVLFSILIAMGVKLFLRPESWLELINAGSIAFVFISIVDFVVVLPEQGKYILKNKVKGFLNR